MMLSKEKVGLLDLSAKKNYRLEKKIIDWTKHLKVLLHFWTMVGLGIVPNFILLGAGGEDTGDDSKMESVREGDGGVTLHSIVHMLCFTMKSAVYYTARGGYSKRLRGYPVPPRQPIH